MAKTKVFVSYDHSEDALYKRLLQAWDANRDFDFEIDIAHRSPVGTAVCYSPLFSMRIYASEPFGPPAICYIMHGMTVHLLRTRRLMRPC